jgi:hypothetical protein
MELGLELHLTSSTSSTSSCNVHRTSDVGHRFCEDFHLQAEAPVASADVLLYPSLENLCEDPQACGRDIREVEQGQPVLPVVKLAAGPSLSQSHTCPS